MSYKLSIHFGELAYDLFNDMVYRLESISTDSQNRMLYYILPWIQSMDFSLCNIEDANLSRKIAVVIEVFNYYNK